VLGGGQGSDGAGGHELEVGLCETSIECNEELSHEGGQCDLGRFAGGAKPLVNFGKRRKEGQAFCAIHEAAHGGDKRGTLWGGLSRRGLKKPETSGIRVWCVCPVGAKCSPEKTQYIE
jgi:hypothetical protein